MKKILVPIDFSRPADNALDYAVSFAYRTGASLQLLHVINMQDQLLNAEELEQDVRQSLEAIRESIEKKYPDLPVTYVVGFGIPAIEIVACTENEKPDIVILGAQGVGYVEERLLGSTSATLIGKVKAPMLIVDRQVKYRELKHVALAADFAETDDINALSPLISLATKIGFHISVLHIHAGLEPAQSGNKTRETFRIEHALRDLPHTFFQTEGAHVISGINDFVEKKKMDMVVMIARKHSFIRRLFREPLTKNMSFHSKVPLLLLHE